LRGGVRLGRVVLVLDVQPDLAAAEVDATFGVDPLLAQLVALLGELALTGEGAGERQRRTKREGAALTATGSLGRLVAALGPATGGDQHQRYQADSYTCDW
jgi:hypothetical protein